MTDPVPSKEWGSPEQVKFVIGFVQATKRTGAEMCPLHVDFLLAVLEGHVHELEECKHLETVDLEDSNARWCTECGAFHDGTLWIHSRRLALPPRDGQ